ncbi:MAG: SDR family oxidoreductase [Chloroflexota bacterium]|nr:SDR family oxidoreductase [Chloroflexota bacterium]
MYALFARIGRCVVAGPSAAREPRHALSRRSPVRRSARRSTCRGPLIDDFVVHASRETGKLTSYYVPARLDRAGLDALSRGLLGVDGADDLPGNLERRLRSESLRPRNQGGPGARPRVDVPDHREILRHAPPQRRATTDDVAKVALFFASDESAYVTGATPPVDGGRTAATPGRATQSS